MITEILPANTLSSGGYDVANSLRFNTASDDYLNRTVGTPTQSLKYTISAWVKRSVQSTNVNSAILGIGNSGSSNAALRFKTNDTLQFYDHVSNADQVNYITNRVFRDNSAWYHVVVSSDRSLGSPETKIFINGVQETSFGTSTEYNQNDGANWNTNGKVLYVGSYNASYDHIDGYLAEVVFADGQILAPTSFGEFDSDSGIWKPISVSGLTFGDEGFYLEFKGSGTSANSSGLGADTSGNDHHFTVNNLTAVDQSTDTCTNNFATLNPLDNLSSGATFSEGNTTVASTNSGRGIMTATFGLTSGKWYWEVKNSASGGTHASDEWNHIGIANRPGSNTDNILAESGTGSNKVYEYTYYAYDGNHWNNGDQGGYGASFTTNDIIGVLLDLDNNKIYWSKNGAWADGSGNSDENDPNGFKAVTDPASTPGGFYFPACGDGGINVSKTWQWNFGGTPGFAVSSGNADPNGYGNFEYPTEGAYAICSKNLAEFGG